MIKKIYNFVKANLLFVETLVLLAFIPLYPKLPLINVNNTWVYIRAEDFLVLGVLLSWLALLVRKKITLRTPLTFPIIIFWIVGAVATIHGVLLIFPTLANTFPNVAFLALVRHVEYLSLFFVAYQGMRDRKFLYFVIGTILITLLAIIFYGFGQKYLSFPAFLTSNEEFAKGIPIQLSELSRVPSTFAGHYDLAAYLVLMIPILTSLFFAIKNLFVKAIILFTSLLSFWLLFMTVSRVSFVVVFVSLFIVFFFQKRKLVLYSVPVIIIGALLFLALKPTILQRFQNTVDTVDVLVDANTGNSIGHVKFVSKEFFQDKIVLSQRVKDQEELVNALAGEKNSSPSAIFPYKFIPNEVTLVKAVNLSTGENLPSGTGYINLALSTVIKRVGNFFYEFPPDVKSSPSAQFLVLHGNFIIKRAAAYDLSFTTRFQGEWPRAIEAFQRQILIGSGYSSVTLAVDNNYLRILGEIGLLGFIAFLSIFFSFFIYLKKVWKSLDYGIEKNFLLGFGAGLVGLGLNAFLIDVFEASKIAYTLWILMGIALGIIVLNLKSEINLFDELKKAAVSTYAIVIYLLGLSIVLYSPLINNFFAGDDFTWLKWAAKAPSNLLTYFTDSGGFFFRPGTKIYFDFMYNTFWLNPAVYHLVSIVLHFIGLVFFFLVAKRVFKSTLLSAFCAFLFLILSGYSEIIFWIAATGHLFTAVFALLGLLLFIKWDETKKVYYYILAFASFTLTLLFHELGVVLPLLVLAYRLKDTNLNTVMAEIKQRDFVILFIPVVLYFVLRLFSNSHWFSGDYNYDLVNLPFNFVGNILGYISIAILGQATIGIYENLRILLRENMVLSGGLVFIGIAIITLIYKKGKNILDQIDKRILFFGASFFIISLLPYLGLGNITSRYSYLSTIGVIFVLVVVFKKIYEFLLESGRNVAIAAMAVLLLIYGFFHIISFQQSAADWHGSSTKVKNFFISFDSYYSDYWSNKDLSFHFLNVPIKWGQAWVFPVGLDDAVWFAVKNDSVKIYKDTNLNDALQAVGSSRTDKIFVFNSDGSLTEVTTRNQPKVN